MTSTNKYIPEPEGLGLELHRASVSTGALHIQQCGDCNEFRHPPRWYCPHCHSKNYEFVPVSGEGTIVDDEAPARDELRHLLDDIAEVRVLGAAATAAEAEELIDGVGYDIVFLDIHMPGVDGLELAARIRDREPRPAVVFTTAFPDHAVDAFELGAIDYLLKPFDEDRLRRSIDRVIRRGEDSGPGVDEPDNVDPIRAEDSVGNKAEGTRIPVQRGDRTVFVDPGDVYFATASRGYSYLKLADDRVLVNFTLAELEARLSDRFVRCHRSHLVNVDRIVEMRPDFKGGLVLRLGDPEQSVVPVSRRQAPALRRRLGV